MTAALSRRLFAGALALAPLAASGPSRARSFTGAEDLRLWARLQADLSGRTAWSYTSGYVWGFKPQADDVALADFARRLYGYQNLVARKIVRLSDASLTIRSKTWIFYRDPQTEAVITRLLNPYTGLMVEARPMSGPAAEDTYDVAGQVLTKPPFPVEVAPTQRFMDMRVRTLGDNSWISTDRFVRFRPGSIGWWKLEGDLIDHACRTRDLADTALTRLPSTWSHNLVAEWQTWMNMHGTPGHILFKGAGAGLAPGDVPAATREAIDTHFPGTFDEALGWDLTG